MTLLWWLYPWTPPAAGILALAVAATTWRPGYWLTCFARLAAEHLARTRRLS